MAIGVGFAGGSIGMLVASVISHTLVDPSYSFQIFLAASVVLFMIGYDITFWGVLRQMEERKVLGHTKSKFDATRPESFRGVLLLVNLFTSTTIIGLLVSSRYSLAIAAITFQAALTGIALIIRKRALSFLGC